MFHQILTHFQNVDRFSKLWPISKMFIYFQGVDLFQNFEPFSRFWPIFKILSLNGPWTKSVQMVQIDANGLNGYKLVQIGPSGQMCNFFENGPTFWIRVNILEKNIFFENGSTLWKWVNIFKTFQFWKFRSARHIHVKCASYLSYFFRASFRNDAHASMRVIQPGPLLWTEKQNPPTFNFFALLECMCSNLLSQLLIRYISKRISKKGVNPVGTK